MKLTCSVVGGTSSKGGRSSSTSGDSDWVSSNQQLLIFNYNKFLGLFCMGYWMHRLNPSIPKLTQYLPTWLCQVHGLAVILFVIHCGTDLMVRGFSPNWDFPWIYIFVRQCSIWLRWSYGRWLASHAVTAYWSSNPGRVKKMIYHVLSALKNCDILGARVRSWALVSYFFSAMAGGRGGSAAPRYAC